MITRMKKLTFLVYHQEYETFLQDIRRLGVVHVVERQRGEMDDTLQRFMQKRTAFRNLLQEITPLARQKDPGIRAERTADELAEAYARLKERRQELQQQQVQVSKNMASMEPWGMFEWKNIERLKLAGWHVQFYVCPEKNFDEAWVTDYNAIKVNEQSGRIYFVTVTPGPVAIDVEPVRLPAESFSELTVVRRDVEASLELLAEETAVFCSTYYNTIEQGAAQLDGEIDLLKVKLSSEAMAEGAVVLLEGWIPEDAETAVRDMLDKSGVYYEIRKAVKTDAAPIKLKNNVFVRMYEVLTGMYGMPDYGEFDPTPLVAPFFTLFFAFCMGDAGYGLVLIALGFFLKSKLSKSLAGMMNLVITLGIATTVFGAVLGTCFGVSLVDVDLPESVKQFMVVGKIGETSYDKQMLLALIIGVVHISIAMTVKAIGATVRYGFKESLSDWGWLLLVVGFVVTGTLQFMQVISTELSNWAFIVIGGISAIGIYLLNNLHRNVLLNIGAGVWDTYNMATGLMGDVLSYIRLYALGLAGGMLGGVFNQLAFMVQDAAGGIPGWVCCGLILVFGHTLNIAMSCLSAFVHPLRLTFVEYFKNSGYEGKGEMYRPFREVEG